jgi:3-oxoadipate enol-lactonase
MREPERGMLEGLVARQRGRTRRALAARHILPAAGAAMAERRPGAAPLYRQIDGLSDGLDKEAVRAAHPRAADPRAGGLAAARTRVLFLAGGRDIVMPPFAARAMAAVIPGARAVTIEGAGHSAYFEAAAAFNALVEAFLDEG